MKIVLHGQVARGEVEADVETAAEAIEALVTQLRPFDHLLLEDRPLMRVVGFPTREDLTSPLPVDVTEIHIIPAMRGGGGKFGSFLIAGVLFVVASMIPMGDALYVALMASAIATAAAGVVNLFMKTPKVSRASDPEASKYFGANTNTIAIGTPIGLAYGRILRYGQLLSINVDAQDMVRGTYPASP